LRSSRGAKKTEIDPDFSPPEPEVRALGLELVLLIPLVALAATMARYRSF